jgi:hypothetical protein
VSGTTPVALAASGGTGLVYRVSVDGTTVYTGTAPGFSWNTTAVANGAHTLVATVTDWLGRATSVSVRVTVSNASATGFTAAITYPASGAVVKGNQSVGMSTTAAWGKPKTFTLSVDGNVLTTATVTGTTLWYTWDTTTVPNGSHQLTLTVTTGTGPTVESSITVTVKN